MKILFLGDIVGHPGVDFVQRSLPRVRAAEDIDIVIANAENASAGTGMTPRTFHHLRKAGIDLMTMGDHVYKKAELISVLQSDDRICRPANFPEEAPGREFVSAKARDGTMVTAFSLLGRTFMRPVDCPFHAADRILKTVKAGGPPPAGGSPAETPPAYAGGSPVILVDVHAEATAEKYLLGHHLKGRVSAVLGTHTHVPTADEQVFPEGTAFISDVGMTGPYDSILGRRVDRVLYTTVTFIPSAFEVATNDPRLAGAIVDVDPLTGKSLSIRRYILDEAGLAKLARST
jgi:calcineurin-like phosphoesterase